MRALVAVASCLLFCAMAARTAECAEPDKRELAKQQFEEAQSNYRLGRFERAIEAYARAYEQLPEPELLFNIAQCHRNLGQLERAVFFYRGYLRESKNPGNSARVEKLIAELEAKIKAQRAEEKQLVVKKRDEGAKLAKVPAPTQPKTELAKNDAATTVEGSVADDGMPVWPWIVGAAVVVVAGGTALAFAMKGDGVPGGVDRDLLLDFRDR